MPYPAAQKTDLESKHPGCRTYCLAEAAGACCGPVCDRDLPCGDLARSQFVSHLLQSRTKRHVARAVRDHRICSIAIKRGRVSRQRRAEFSRAISAEGDLDLHNSSRSFDCRKTAIASSLKGRRRRRFIYGEAIWSRSALAPLAMAGR